MGIWPIEKSLVGWNLKSWKPKFQCELKLGSKGFFMVIFHNPEDKNHIFQEGPYFLHFVWIYICN